jgi:hypothetical protein
MTTIPISLSRLKRQVETQAYAYGVSPAVSTLLGEYVTALIKSAGRERPEPVAMSVPKC